MLRGPSSLLFIVGSLLFIVGSLLFTLGSLVCGVDRSSSEASTLGCTTIMMQSLAVTLASTIAVHRRGGVTLRRALVTSNWPTVKQLLNEVSRRRRVVTHQLFAGREHRWPGILRRPAVSRRSRAADCDRAPSASVVPPSRCAV